jgi:hypothetical protein
MKGSKSLGILIEGYRIGQGDGLWDGQDKSFEIIVERKIGNGIAGIATIAIAQIT